MSIKKKIILIFSASFAIVALFGISAIYDFLEARRDFAFLEVSDSIRSKTLQIRRHEKNFFLYGDFSEIQRINRYFTQIDTLIKKGEELNPNDRNLLSLATRIQKYKKKFSELVEIASQTRTKLSQITSTTGQYQFIVPIMESTFLEHPEQIEALLKHFFSMSDASDLIKSLRQINIKVRQLRVLGEKIIEDSREVDRAARYRVEYVIKASEVGILIVFPLAFIFGFIALFKVTQDIVRRLNELMVTIEKLGKGFYSSLPFPSGKDEISTLIRTYNNMAEALKDREMQLIKKEEELLRHRKLAAIGTLASGVAHELTNPLNNIHLSAQVLAREIKHDEGGIIKETVEDILSQSLRVKKIVADLLEFAREKKPQKTKVNLSALLKDAYAQVEKLYCPDNVRFSMDAPEEVFVNADPAQMERVFINLFKNAIDAMPSGGEIRVTLQADDDVIKVEISDTGPGIPEQWLDKIFDPFFTTKDRGTGLGLSIVYNIIKQHYGRIEVSSSEQGTTFTIYIPRDL